MNDLDLDRLSQEVDMGEPGPSHSPGSEIDMLRQELRRLRAALPEPPFVRAPAHEDYVDRLPRDDSDPYATRSLANIERLVIHHSAVPADIGADQIARYQVERRGWPAIGYHYFIRADGTILKTNELEVVSFHTRHQSETSVGICLAGRFDTAPPPDPQLDAAAALCAHLCGRLGLQATLGGIVGHGEVTRADCPGPHWAGGMRWRNSLLERVRQIQRRAVRQGTRAIGHYMLFWEDANTWDSNAWNAALRYIGRFRPVCGFSLEAASQADYVTIVGDEELFPPTVEATLRDAGCVTERIAEREEVRLREIFDDLVANERRFLTLKL